MVMNIREYKMGPFLTAAVLLIAYDNGAINRQQSQEYVLQAIKGAVGSAFSNAELEEVERELSHFSAQELEDVCIGKDGTPEYLAASELVRKVLDTAWEALP